MSIIKVNTVQTNTAGNVTVSSPVAMSSTLDVTGATTLTGNFTSRSIADTGTTTSGRIAVSNSAVTVTPNTTFSGTVTANGLVTASAGLTSSAGTTTLGSTTATNLTVSGTLTLGTTPFTSSSPVLLRAWGEVDIVFLSTSPHTTIDTITLVEGFNCTVAKTAGGANGAFIITLGDDQVDTDYTVIFQDNYDGASTQSTHTAATERLVYPKVTAFTAGTITCAVKNWVNGTHTANVKFIVPNNN